MTTYSADWHPVVLDSSVYVDSRNKCLSKDKIQGIEPCHDMISLILLQNIKAEQRGIHYLSLLNILDIFDDEIFTCSGEKKEPY